MYTVWVQKYSKTHRDMYVYSTALKRWVRFGCSLPPAYDCLGPSIMGRGQRWLGYSRPARADEFEAIESALLAAERSGR